MVVTRLSFPFESSENTCTVLRSASSNTYLPGTNTFPGICTGSLNWNSVLLFHSSAFAGFVIRKPSAKAALRHSAFNLLFISFLLHLSMERRHFFASTRSCQGRWISESWTLISKEFVSSAPVPELIARQCATSGRHFGE